MVEWRGYRHGGRKTQFDYLLAFRNSDLLLTCICSQLNGWPNNVLGPSTEPYNEKLPKPKEMTKSDIEHLKEAWVAATKRAVTAGFDVIEIHNGTQPQDHWLSDNAKS